MRGVALGQLGREDEADEALEAALAQARERGDRLEVVLALDALSAFAGAGAGACRRRERDATVERLDIVRLPPCGGGRHACAGRRGGWLTRDQWRPSGSRGSAGSR